ncbi:hypothetical protein QJS10_CPB13g01392 [Acorus calamus]|uniref:Uncharacterized protein n=1 Tax=Acorus calamus TaxID=4465 RepID=A0AAV9DIK4_ACOCL|nr:hypothetical protein QJS10_CPB13g01392 [Acorus calamus]
MPPRKNLPSFPPPVTQSALRTALSNLGGLPNDVPRPDGDPPRHDADKAIHEAEATKLRHTVDEMRRENECLRNLLGKPPGPGVRSHRKMPQGDMPSAPLNPPFPCGRRLNEGIPANHAHEEEPTGSSNMAINSKRPRLEDPGLREDLMRAVDQKFRTMRPRTTADHAFQIAELIHLSPLSADILRSPRPDKFTPPKFKLYEGKTDPT